MDYWGEGVVSLPHILSVVIADLSFLIYMAENGHNMKRTGGTVKTSIWKEKKSSHNHGVQQFFATFQAILQFSFYF